MNKLITADFGHYCFETKKNSIHTQIIRHTAAGRSGGSPLSHLLRNNIRIGTDLVVIAVSGHAEQIGNGVVLVCAEGMDKIANADMAELLRGVSAFFPKNQSEQTTDCLNLKKNDTFELP